MVRPSRMIRPPRNPSGLRSGTVLRRGPWRPPLGHLTPWLGGGCNRRGPQGRRGVVVLLVQPIAEPLALPMIHPGMKRSHTKSYDTLPAAQPRLLFPEQTRRFLHAALLKSTGVSIERGCFEPQPLPRVAPCGDGRKNFAKDRFRRKGWGWSPRRPVFGSNFVLIPPESFNLACGENGGRGGIRTHGGFNPTFDFESSALNQLSHPSFCANQLIATWLWSES